MYLLCWYTCITNINIPNTFFLNKKIIVNKIIFLKKLILIKDKTCFALYYDFSWNALDHSNHKRKYCYWCYMWFWLTEPWPSQDLQQIFRGLLLREKEAATRFLDTLINQLNWSFSEFIGLMQEVNVYLSNKSVIYSTVVMIYIECIFCVVVNLRCNFFPLDSIYK